MQYVQIQEKPTWNTEVFYFFVAGVPYASLLFFNQNAVFLFENIYVCMRG